MATEPGLTDPLAAKDESLHAKPAKVTILPSKHGFTVEGQNTLLEAAMSAGIPLGYGCSNGNCGLCKARVVSGEVRKTRHHDFPIPETEQQAGYVLLCSNTAVSDLVIEAPVAGSAQDIPFQQIEAQVKMIGHINDDVLLLHLQTSRTKRLRFLAGQGVTLCLGHTCSSLQALASCPCDDRNLLFHIQRQPGNPFSDYAFDKLKTHEVVELEGPQGEFVLQERSQRSLYFFAFDCGFAPVKSLIEHALSLEIEDIHLHWIGSSRQHIYLPNIARAWDDALDSFHYQEHVAGFDLCNINDSHAEALHALLQTIQRANNDLSQADIYIAGPQGAADIAERFFTDAGSPKTRISVSRVK